MLKCGDDDYDDDMMLAVDDDCDAQHTCCKLNTCEHQIMTLLFFETTTAAKLPAASCTPKCTNTRLN